MSQEERISEFMRMMQEALQKTGITVAVEAGRNLTLFDTKINEPVELEITVGTEVVKKDGMESITTFDNSEMKS